MSWNSGNEGDGGEGNSECECVNEDVGNDATHLHYGKCKNECVASCMHGCVST